MTGRWLLPREAFRLLVRLPPKWGSRTLGFPLEIATVAGLHYRPPEPFAYVAGVRLKGGRR